MKHWNEMEPHERDAWVAEHVMGWKETDYNYPGSNRRWFIPDEAYIKAEKERGQHILATSAPPFSTYPASDYEVLRKMMSHPDVLVQRRFEVHLISLSGCLDSPSRSIHLRGLLMKHAESPGLFSHAAWLTLNEEQTT